jgi:hypothetical protein
VGGGSKVKETPPFHHSAVSLRNSTLARDTTLAAHSLITHSLTTLSNYAMTRSLTTLQHTLPLLQRTPPNYIQHAAAAASSARP